MSDDGLSDQEAFIQQESTLPSSGAKKSSSVDLTGESHTEKTKSSNSKQDEWNEPKKSKGSLISKSTEATAVSAPSKTPSSNSKSTSSNKGDARSNGKSAEKKKKNEMSEEEAHPFLVRMGTVGDTQDSEGRTQAAGPPYYCFTEEVGSQTLAALGPKKVWFKTSTLYEKGLPKLPAKTPPVEYLNGQLREIPVRGQTQKLVTMNGYLNTLLKKRWNQNSASTETKGHDFMLALVKFFENNKWPLPESTSSANAAKTNVKITSSMVDDEAQEKDDSSPETTDGEEAEEAEESRGPEDGFESEYEDRRPNEFPKFSRLTKKRERSTSDFGLDDLDDVFPSSSVKRRRYTSVEPEVEDADAPLNPSFQIFQQELINPLLNQYATANQKNEIQFAWDNYLLLVFTTLADAQKKKVQETASQKKKKKKH